MEALVPIPDRGRVFARGRRIRLADIDARGRLRLDAVARFRPDLAIDDVEETGWGAPEHRWFLRSVRVDVLVPFLRDRQVDTTSGDATVERTQESLVCWPASEGTSPASGRTFRARVDADRSPCNEDAASRSD
jgi:hypothetical protein